jgi:rhodanese-related sulfurtransferase
MTATTAIDLRARPFPGVVRQAVMLMLAAVIPALIAAVCHPLRPPWSRDLLKAPEVTWSTVTEWRGLVLLVDARPTADFEKDHVPGAFSLNEQHWEERLPIVIKAWQPGARVVVYCASDRCESSHSVARRLKHDMGTDGIFVLKGGWTAWIAAHPQQR